MRFGAALAITCALSTPVAADAWGKDWDDDDAGLRAPFAHKEVVAFFDANPAAKTTITTDKLDKLLVPGGNVCKLPDYPDTKGGSSYSFSPDRNKLVIFGSAKLSKRTAKALKLAADPEAVAHVVVVIDGPTGVMWTKRLEGDGCGFIDAHVMWNVDSTKFLAIAEHGDRVPDATRALVVDVVAKKLRMQGDLLIEHEQGEQLRYSDPKFASATRVTVCVARPDKSGAPQLYRLEDESVIATKLGPCPTPKPAPAK